MARGNHPGFPDSSTHEEKSMGEPVPVLISDWSAECCPDDAFTAPEARDHIHLAGVVAGRNGPVLTSRIVAAEGRIVTTKSGSVYRLGRPAAKFLAWLRERGKPYDRAEPIKVRPTPTGAPK